MATIKENITTWNKYDWVNQGAEWSAPWGGVFPQWATTIYPRIAKFYSPSSREMVILEIAPGFGRWTQFLIPGAKIYRGVDLSINCVEACRKHFAQTENADFFLNDGKDLSMVSDIKYDFVFSFDSLVHADMEALEQYIRQIVQLLAPGGAAFLHHSNLGMYNGQEISNTHWRGTDVSAEKIEKVINESGGQLLVQEMLCWGEEYILNDCFSLFSAKTTYPDFKTRKITSKSFPETEVAWARDTISNYLEIT